MILYYIIGCITGFLICDIIRGVETRLREYPLQQAMYEQQLRFIRENSEEKEVKK